MQKKVLSEIDLYYGEIKTPKGFEIIRDAIKNSILDSFIKEKKLADSIADLTNVFDNEFTKYNTALEIKNYMYVFGILSEVQKKVIEYREENDVILISDISELLNKSVNSLLIIF